jgi:hypothetical protein
MLHRPRSQPCSDRTCTHHNRNGRPYLMSMWEGMSVGRFTQVLGLPIYHILGMCLVLSNSWHTVPHINPYSISSHRQGIPMDPCLETIIIMLSKVYTTNSRPRTSARKITWLLPRSWISISTTQPSILVSISKETWVHATRVSNNSYT